MNEQKIAPALNNDEVICPACAHQFRAIPVNVQAVLARVGAVREWQPIETAPKDGTDILLYRDADMHEGKPVPARHTVGNWLHEEGGTTEYRDLDGHYVGQNDRDGFDGWVSWDGGFTEGKPPTHWMPMPGPPGAIRALKGTPAAAVPTDESVCKGSMALGSGCGKCARCLAEMADAAAVADAQPVGVAFLCPGKNLDKTQCNFMRKDVPEGTKLYAAPQAGQLSGNAGEVPRPIIVTRTSENTVMLAFESGARADLYERAAIAASKGASNADR